MEEDTDSPFLSSQGSSLSSSGSTSPPESFLFETKYVILHFLGLLPVDLYSGHLSSSATSLASNNSPSLFKPNGREIRAQSLSPSPPKLKRIGQLKSDDLSSPASDDNIQYQYSANKNVENHVTERNSGPDSVADRTECAPYLKYFQAISLDQERSLSLRRLSQSSPCLQRASSEASCDTEFSYHSDADDEFDISNASSIFSNHSFPKTGRFVDLLQTSTRLTTLKSESDFETNQKFVSASVPNRDYIEQHDRISSTESGCVFKKRDNYKVESGTEAQSSTKSNSVERFDECRSEEINPVGHFKEANGITADEATSERNEDKIIKTNAEEDDSATENKDNREGYNNVLANQNSLCEFRTRGSELPDTLQTSGELSERLTCQNVGRNTDRSKLKLEIRNNYVNLDEIVLSLQSELQEELTELESEMEDAFKRTNSSSGLSPRSSPLTPQSEAARMLAQIGDEVKDQYEQQLSQAIRNLVYTQLKEMTYIQFKALAKCVMDHNLPEWRQVALLLVFSQGVVWHSLQCGQRKLGHLIDYTSQLLAELAADFIIKQGGWGAVMNFDSSQSSDISTPLSSSSSPGLFRYYHNLSGTKVESVTRVQSATSSELLFILESNGVFSTSENSLALADIKDKMESSELKVTQSTTSPSAQQRHSSDKVEIPVLKHKTESLGFVLSKETELDMQTTSSGELEEDLFTANVDANEGLLSNAVPGLICVTVPNVSQDTVPGVSQAENTSPTERTKTENWFNSNLLHNVDLRILALSLGIIALCYGIKIVILQN